MDCGGGEWEGTVCSVSGKRDCRDGEWDAAVI